MFAAPICKLEPKVAISALFQVEGTANEWYT